MFQIARVLLVCTILVLVVISGGCDSPSEARRKLEAKKTEQYREMIRQGQLEALLTPTATQLPYGWHDNLRTQIQLYEGCEAESIWNVWKLRSGQDAVLVAVGVQCVDGRRFMAYPAGAIAILRIRALRLVRNPCVPFSSFAVNCR